MARNRFDRSLFYKYTKAALDFDAIESPFEDGIRTLPLVGVYTVSDADAHKIDEIARSIYGDYEFYWILVEYNVIPDLFNLESGSKILYPSISSIEELLYEVSSSLNVFEE